MYSVTIHDVVDVTTTKWQKHTSEKHGEYEVKAIKIKTKKDDVTDFTTITLFKY